MYGALLVVCLLFTFWIHTFKCDEQSKKHSTSTKVFWKSSPYKHHSLALWQLWHLFQFLNFLFQWKTWTQRTRLPSHSQVNKMWCHDFMELFQYFVRTSIFILFSIYVRSPFFADKIFDRFYFSACLFFTLNVICKCRCLFYSCWRNGRLKAPASKN